VLLRIDEWHVAEQELYLLMQLIPATEQSLLMGKRRHQDLLLSLGARLIVLIALASLFPAAWKRLEWCRDNLGRLYMNSLQFDFNISHHREWIGVVISTTNRVGLDIVCFDNDSNDDDDTSSIIDSLLYQFSQQETANIMAQVSLSESLRHLYTLWAVKEAYTKAIGQGLKKDFAQLEVNTQNGNEQFSEITLHDEGQLVVEWKSFLFKIDVNYHGCVCINVENGVQSDISMQVITPHHLRQALAQINDDLRHFYYCTTASLPLADFDPFGLCTPRP